MIVINVLWCFTIVLLGALVVSLFVPIMVGEPARAVLCRFNESDYRGWHST